MRKALLSLALTVLASITTYGSTTVTQTAWNMDISHRVVVVLMWFGLCAVWVALAKVVCTDHDSEQ